MVVHLHDVGRASTSARISQSSSRSLRLSGRGAGGRAALAKSATTNLELCDNDNGDVDEKKETLEASPAIREARARAEAAARVVDTQQMVTAAHCYVAPGFITLQEAERTLRPNIDLGAVFDSDYLADLEGSSRAVHQQQRQRARDPRQRGLQASSATSVAPIPICNLNVSNRSPLEGTRARIIAKAEVHSQSTPPALHESESQDHGVRLFAHTGGANGWVEIRTAAEFQGAMRVWASYSEMERATKLEAFLDNLSDMREAEEEPSCTLALHALWDLSVDPRNRLAMQSKPRVLRALVGALSDDRPVYCREEILSPSACLCAREAAAAALLNVCADARDECLCNLHKGHTLSKCVAALARIGSDSCVYAEHIVSDENGEASSQGAVAETLCTLIGVLSTSKSPPLPKEVADLLRKHSNFILSVLQATQRPPVFSSLIAALCAWLSPVILRDAPYLLETGEMRWSLVICSLLHAVTHNPRAKSSDILTVVATTARCVACTETADHFAGVFPHSATSVSRYEGYQVVNLSMVYHISRCINTSLRVLGIGGHAEDSGPPNPLAVDLWRLQDGKSMRELHEEIIDRSLAALRGLIVQHARQSVVAAPAGTLTFLWKLLTFMFTAAPRIRDRVLVTLASCCYLEGFVETVPPLCAASVVHALADAEQLGDASLAVILRALSSDAWGCAFLRNYAGGMGTLVRHLRAAKDADVRVLLATALGDYAVNAYGASRSAGQMSSLESTSSRSSPSGESRSEWTRWARGLDKITPHEKLDRFGTLTMDLGEDFDEECLSIHCTLEGLCFDENAGCTSVSRENLHALCKLLQDVRGSENSGDSADEAASATIIDKVAFALRVVCELEENLEQFDAASVESLLGSTLACVSSGVRCLQRLVQVLELLCESAHGLTLITPQLTGVTDVVQIALYLQAQDDPLAELLALTDDCLRLLWKLARGGASMVSERRLLDILARGVSQPELTFAQRQTCANILLTLCLDQRRGQAHAARGDDGTEGDDTACELDVRGALEEITECVDPALLTCLECLHSDNRGLQVVGAHFLLTGACTGPQALQRFTKASGLRKIVEMAWQSESITARANGLHALRALSLQSEHVQITLARDALVALILLAQHLGTSARPAESSAMTVFGKGQQQEESAEGLDVMQRCVAQTIAALQSNHRNRTVLYQTELRLSQEATLTYETYRLPWVNADDTNSSGSQVSGPAMDAVGSEASLQAQFQEWMGTAFYHGGSRRLNRLSRPSAESQKPNKAPGARRRPQMLQRRLLYKSTKSLWKSEVQLQSGSRWEPQVTSAKMVSTSRRLPAPPALQDKAVDPARFPRDPSRAGFAQKAADEQRAQSPTSSTCGSVDGDSEGAVKIVRDDVGEQRRREILRSVGIRLRDASLKEKRYRLVTNRAYEFSTAESSLKFVPGSGQPRAERAAEICIFNHVPGSRVHESYGIRKVHIDDDNAVFVYTTLDSSLPQPTREEPGAAPQLDVSAPTFSDFQKSSIRVLYKANALGQSGSEAGASPPPLSFPWPRVPPVGVFARFRDYLARRQVKAPWDRHGELRSAPLALALVSPHLYKMVRRKNDEDEDDEGDVGDNTTKSFRRRRRNKLKKPQPQ